MNRIRGLRKVEMGGELDGALRDLLEQIRTHEDCSVFAPAGLPRLDDSDTLPADLRAFYEHCGGLVLFGASAYTIGISPPARLLKSNPEIRGESAPEDRSDSWYIIARGENSEAISIDLSPARAGRCYDSLWDRHAVAGSCPVIAGSFTELLAQLFAAQGGEWYWTKAEFTSLGDAYDD